MTTRSGPPRLAAATPLRPATYAGIAAALVSILAAVVIRLWPPLEALAGAVHLVLAFMFYAMGGVLAASLGADGWRAGLFAGLLDALIGHAIAFFIAGPPDPTRVTLPAGIEVTPQVLARVQLWGAVTGAGFTIVMGAIAGAVGGWYARRARVAA